MNLDNIDFLIIGAAKSATTWLQKSLQTDPAISMPHPELHYFSRKYERGDSWYLSQFPDPVGARLLGEKSNSYLDDPKAPARIHDKLPNVKLIAQLRNPVARAYSDYCMLLRRGEVDGRIERHLDPDKAAGNRFLRGGRYYEQLQRYDGYYADGRLKILLYEDLETDPAAQVDIVRAFLGLEPSQKSMIVRDKVKDKTLPIVPLPLRRVLRPLKQVTKPVRHTRPLSTIRDLIAREPAFPPLSDKLYHELTDYYSKEAELLGTLMGRDLSGWLHASNPGRAQEQEVTRD